MTTVTVLFALLALSSIVLATRPRTGPWSVAETPGLQFLLFACALGWGAVCGVTGLVAMAIMYWNEEPRFWIPVVTGILGLVVSFSLLSRRWRSTWSEEAVRRGSASTVPEQEKGMK